MSFEDILHYSSLDAPPPAPSLPTPVVAADAEKVSRRGGRTQNLTYEQKAIVIKKRTVDKGCSQKDIAAWAKEEFNLEHPISQATISNIFRNSEKILIMADCRGLKRHRKLTCEQLDTELAAWTKQENKGSDIPGILAKAQSLGNELKEVNPGIVLPIFSNGWLQSFRQRHGFVASGSDNKDIYPRLEPNIVDDLYILKKTRKVFDTLGLPTHVIDEAENKVQERAVASNLILDGVLNAELNNL